jgi:hypothetical protein
MASSKSSSTTKLKVLSRIIKLTYLQTQQVMGGGRDLGQLVGEGGGVGTISSSSSKAGSPGFLGIGAEGGSSSSSSSTDTGWVISRVWNETYFDKVAWRVGIRDIGVFNYRFDTVSEFVSVKYSTPKEISKVSLRVVEQTPAAYPIGQRYIEYYVTPDDGKTWHQINPLDHPTLVVEGQVVPRIITFNPEIGGDSGELQKYVTTDKPVAAVRLRVVFRGAQDIEQADRYTPVLKRYRLLLFPLHGL